VPAERLDPPTYWHDVELSQVRLPCVCA
jgi:hypothetical protein